MDTIHHEVPNHQVHENRVVNGVSVVGGTNWDLSRTAVVTPITQYATPAPPPQPVLEIPQDRKYQAQLGLPVEAASLEVTFKPGQRTLTKAQRDGLALIPAGNQAVVVAYGANKRELALANARAKQVAQELKRRGVVVHDTKAHNAAAGLENRLEVYFGPLQ